MDSSQYGEIRNDIVALLQAARTASARSVNALMAATYWEIGRRIVEFEQQGQERAEYGEAIIKQLAEDLEPRFGRALGVRHVRSAHITRGSVFCHRLRLGMKYPFWVFRHQFVGRMF
jgi:DUF1016 N-terminal domain